MNIRKIKNGICSSSGCGAKGAHLGSLKVLEKMGVPALR